MRWLIIVLFLVPFGSVCMGEEGTVYYCIDGVSTSIKQRSPGKVDHSNDIGKFTFKVTKDKIIFGRSDFFSFLKLDLMFKEFDGRYLVAQYMESGKDNKWHSLISLVLKGGKFSLSFTGKDTLLYYTATCSKF